MSSSSSSSTSNSQRPPLHERSNSETNKLGIRIVPYSPPRLDRESIGSASQGPTTDAGYDGSNQFSDDGTPTKEKRSIARDESYATHPGASLASPTPSATSLVRAKGRGVSDSASSGAGPSTPPPVHNWSSYGSQRSSLNAGSESGLNSPSSKTPSHRSRRDNIIAVHPDKTFSVVLKPTGYNLRLSDRTATDTSIRSPPVSTYSTVSSHEAFSFDAPDDDRPSSALSSLPERSVSPGTPGSAPPAKAAEDQSPSPWNQRIVSRLRKVPSTPEQPEKKGKDKDVFVSGPSSPLPTLREVPSSSPEPEPELPPSSLLEPKPSFNSQTSEGTATTIEETANYKVFGRSTPPPPEIESSSRPSSNSDSNYEVLGRSSPVFPTPPPRVSSKNFSVHQGSSSSDLLRTPTNKKFADFPSSPPEVLDTPGSQNFIVHPSPAHEALNDTPGSKNFIVHPSPAPEPLGTPGSTNFITHPSSPLSILDTPGSKNFVVHPSPVPEPWDTPGSRNIIVHPSSPPSILDTPGSNNFIVHPGASPAPSGYDSLPLGSSRPGSSRPSSSRPTTAHRPRRQYSDENLALREKYSQESLVVRPLNTGRSSPEDRFGYFKQKSREHLRRASSFSSISSVISQDPSILLANAVNIVPLSRAQLASTFVPQPSWVGRPRMDAHPHQWSSQLSTVLSEDESSEAGSRHLSVSDQRSLSYASRDSRQMLSMSSSMLADEYSSDSQRPRSRSHSRTGSGPFMRGARELPNPPRMVRDVDEHGDGLADLHELHHKGSRTRLAQFLSHKASDVSLRSTSSRAGSINSATIPVWAKIYYGSGERKWLQSPSMLSFSDDSRPASSLGPSGSPALDQFPPNIFTPRRRPREIIPDMEDRPISTEVVPIRLSAGIQLGVRRMTSSIWSPHLQTDRRASRLSIWQPPSITWSADTGFLGRRNMQVVLFAIGFVFPLAWMIAAFLPLPPKYAFDMAERDHSTTQFGIPNSPDPMGREAQALANNRHHSARWWRNLNRIMSVIGLLVIGAIVALAIVGFWQNMARR